MPANAGQAGVRRRGIIEATGEFLIHLDGDDWVDADYYETLYKIALETGADIVVGDEVMEYPDKIIPKENPPLPQSGKEIMMNWYKDTVGLFCHNKLVRRRIYTDNDILPWENLNMWEDNGLFARLFYHAEVVAQAHGPVYHYNRCNLGAMTAGYGEKQVDQMIEIAKSITAFFQSKTDYKDFEKTVKAFQYLAKLNLITDSLKKYRRFKTLFPESDSIASEIPGYALSSKGRIRFKMVRMGLAPLFILLFKAKSMMKL